MVRKQRAVSTVRTKWLWHSFRDRPMWMVIVGPSGRSLRSPEGGRRMEDLAACAPDAGLRAGRLSLLSLLLRSRHGDLSRLLL